MYDSIQDLIDKEAPNFFMEWYLEKASKQEISEQGLGIIISQWSDQTLGPIMNVFYAALEDANFHELNEQIQEVCDKYLEEDS